MLNILSQDGKCKYETGTYYVGVCRENLNNTRPAICIYVPGKDAATIVAVYNNQKDADAIFAHMIFLEGSVQDKMGMFRPTIAVLPKDDPTEISNFLKSNFGYNLLKYNLEKNSENVK